MKDPRLYFNIGIIVFVWIITAYFSSILSIIVVLGTFILLFFKNLTEYFFFLFYLLLVISDSRLEMLNFAAEVKPYVAIVFGLSGILLLIKNHFKQNLIIIFFSGFVLSIFFSFFNSDDYFICFQKSISYIFLLIAVPSFITKNLDEYGYDFIKTFIYLFLGVIILGCVFYFINPNVTILIDRYRGLFGNPNGLGISCLLMFFLFQVVKSKCPDLFTKKEHLLIVFLIIINLIFTGSRSSLLVLIMFYVFSWANNISTLFATILILIFGAGYTLIFSNIILLINYFNLESFIRIETFENASGRFVAWNFLWEKLDRSFFVFGEGMGSTETLYNLKYNLLSRLGHQGNAHNSFLTIWYDTGLFGLIGFIIGVFLSFFYSVRENKALPILIGIIVSSFFESWLSASLNPFTILFLIIISLISYMPKKNDETIKVKNHYSIIKT